MILVLPKEIFGQTKERQYIISDFLLKNWEKKIWSEFLIIIIFVFKHECSAVALGIPL